VYIVIPQKALKEKEKDISVIDKSRPIRGCWPEGYANFKHP
jgi:hypothetical protein